MATSIPAISDPIGEQWLIQHYQLEVAGTPPVVSGIGGRRATLVQEGARHEFYVEAMRPADTLAAHLQFHLRHEIPHFEFLCRLFSATGAEPIQHFIDQSPTSQYARRAAFLYEWFSAQKLEVPKRLGGNYVDVLNDNLLVTASPEYKQRSQRWRVNDNMPGSPDFCPLVIKTQALQEAASLDIQHELKALNDEFGEDLLMRAAVWLTLRESRASFAIEGEAEQEDRVKRFAHVMAQYIGQGDIPLTQPGLQLLQQQILGQRTSLTYFGIRQSPVFIGEVTGFREVLHYVAPPSQWLEAMLAGLLTFLARTQGQSAVMRTAVAAFGFIYIHPLADGNGRVHRFLINDILRREGVIPDGMILPISAAITRSSAERRDYDRVLDTVSAPLMQMLEGSFQLSHQDTLYPDGIRSNLTLDNVELVAPVWQFPDLSAHVLFLARLIALTIHQQMRDESRYLRDHLRARSALKQVVEMPDPQADRVIRVIEENNGKLSSKLAKEIPILAEPGVWQSIVEAVQAVIEPAP